MSKRKAFGRTFGRWYSGEKSTSQVDNSGSRCSSIAPMGRQLPKTFDSLTPASLARNDAMTPASLRHIWEAYFPLLATLLVDFSGEKVRPKVRPNGFDLDVGSI